jgi:small-conductance mechanosensitive channel
MQPMFEELVKQVSRFFPQLAMSVLIFLAFWLASVVTRKIIGRLRGRSDIAQDVLNLLQQTVQIALLIFGGITALGAMNINVSALVTGLGLTGFALGFAFKDILSNLLAGALILIYHPFRRNDRIAVLGFEGVVIEIGLRYTVLQAEDKKILIPNSNLFTNPVSVLEGKRDAESSPRVSGR